MKVQILPSAIEDLERGRNFYDKQGEGLGQYFLNSPFSDIDSLTLYAGIHQCIGIIIDCCRSVFLTISIS